MGISVISSPPKGLTPVATLTKAAPTENMNGEFAALLSGELLNPKGLMLEPPVKLLSATALGQRPTQPTEEESSGEAASPFDPSILAALTCNPALQPESINRGTSASQTGDETTEKRIAEFNTSRLDSLSSRPESRNTKNSPPETLNTSDKLVLVPPQPEQLGANTTPTENLRPFEEIQSATIGSAKNGTATSQAANIAAETNSFDLNSPALTSAPGVIANAKHSNEAPATDTASISSHLRESSWSQQFGEKIVWLVKSDQQTAQININPRELGPVQITLNLNGDQAKLAFTSPHAEVRQAIESALPHLKEMLSSAGINLGQANVGANLAQHNPDNPQQHANGKRLVNENAILPANEVALSSSSNVVLQRGRGLVDLFA